MSPDLKVVAQEHAAGCGIAVLAMLTEQTYAQVQADIEADPWAQRAGDWAAVGITQIHIEKYLGDRGWFMRRVYSSYQSGGVWPPEPFAEAHYCIVQQPSGNGHFVVMDGTGRVLDPLHPTTVARLSDWSVVNCVVGLRAGLPQ